MKLYGATDDFGFKPVEKPVHGDDIHAMIDFRLTDVSGNVLRGSVAQA